MTIEELFDEENYHDACIAKTIEGFPHLLAVCDGQGYCIVTKASHEKALLNCSDYEPAPDEEDAPAKAAYDAWGCQTVGYRTDLGEGQLAALAFEHNQRGDENPDLQWNWWQ